MTRRYVRTAYTTAVPSRYARNTAVESTNMPTHNNHARMRERATAPIPAARRDSPRPARSRRARAGRHARSEEHTSELQSQSNLVCRLLLEKKKTRQN